MLLISIVHPFGIISKASIDKDVEANDDGEKVQGAFQKRGHFLSPERASHTSPGQRPG